MFVQVQSDEEQGGNVVLLAPNERRALDPRPERLDLESFHLDLSRVDPGAEMAWFGWAFAKELDIVRKVYATVTLKWGLHQFYL